MKATSAIALPIAGAVMALALFGGGCESDSTEDPGGIPGGYVVVDTGQNVSFGNTRQIATPSQGGAFSGQDAQYAGPQPAYTGNGDGTVTDLNTGLMWQQDPGAKTTYDMAARGAGSFRLGGYDDWRLPTIKELYSLIDFSGSDPSGYIGSDTSRLTPFIDARFFDFSYGNAAVGERIIDSQYASSTLYVANTGGDGGRTLFGVNFADGRIKGYGLTIHGADKTFFVMYVRGNPEYGRNLPAANGDGTVTDTATGLMWQQADSGRGMNWQGALAYAEGLALAGHTDWRLPNAKELQSIVDYARSPDTTGSAAIDPVFAASAVVNEAGARDYPCYWTSTTHAAQNGMGEAAAYVAFGRAMGNMRGGWLDVHGAGAQRSDPKSGDPAAWPFGRGPQGDAIRIHNYVRCVRNR